jgi:hypothetical protein
LSVIEKTFTSKGITEAIDLAIDHALRDAISPHVVVSPLVLGPDGRPPRYFMICTCDKNGFRSDQVILQTKDDRAGDECSRASFLLALVLRRPPLVVHDTADELDALKICEALWPGEKITRLRKDTEAERARP